ncbi:acyltransferase [Kaistia dalseonensis]|uniref:Fucose 4-O-acetylase-like acetyltransferase n=1 Tax=Kaistia dalseonensis TaxID=410840 RepID=A0ABU0H204_9HYPH|nr:acyltransferase [Kaistia dalseonensis]MCX5493774.1 acyltransferase [Kaistia dalseonensis]MDQ0436338.1 fucose 4-O-acetylase-like acetyltransferase [Kaistia dalseonensis]
MSAAAEGHRSRERLLDIERGKGLGIMLVVYGHLLMYGTLGEQLWYAASKSAVYLFHMPFFMYLSGFIYFYTAGHKRFGSGYPQYVARRADRLLVPFLAMLVLVVTGKYIASRYTYVDAGVASYWEGYRDAVFNTEYSPVLSIWYIFVLFVYSIAVPVLWRLAGARVLILVALGFILYFTPATTDFYIYRIFHYFIFFVMGGLAFLYKDVALAAYRKYLPLWLVLFAASLFLNRDWYPAVLISGLLSIPALHGLVRLDLFSKDRILLYLGANSMVIYLFNTIFIGVAKAIYIKILPYDGIYFVFFMLVLFLCGLLLPLVVKNVMERLAVARPLLRYVT